MDREIRLGLLATLAVLAVYLPVLLINNFYLDITLILLSNFVFTVVTYKIITVSFLKMKENFNKNNFKFVFSFFSFAFGIIVYLILAAWHSWLLLNILHLKGLIYFKFLIQR
jgi:hypothetical protein